MNKQFGTQTDGKRSNASIMRLYLDPNYLEEYIRL